MPLLVQVHEWGGNFQRQEDLAAWVPEEYDFVMLYFQYQPSSNNEDDWWFGTHWDGQCHMWAHQAVMTIVREVIASTIVPDNLAGVTVDPERVWLYGHSIGGTGAWQLGIRNPDVFAAVHAHSGFARFTDPVGPFQVQFDADIVGGPGEGIVVTADDGLDYPARDYSNLAWWLQNYRDPSAEAPFVAITAGTGDDTVPAASGGDLMQPVLDSQRRGFYYYRHAGGHSDYCFIQMNWLWNFRHDQSFLAFTNRAGYGVAPGEIGEINDLNAHSWDPESIVDQLAHYEVQLLGPGTADVTPRRLRNFVVTPNGAYTYWLDQQSGPGTALSADGDGLLTVPAVAGAHLLIVEPSEDQDQVEVGTAGELANAVAAANAGGPRTILLGDGTYTLDQPLLVETAGVTVRGLSGNRDTVILEGAGMTGAVSHIFAVIGDNFTAADMTLRRVANHAVQIHGELDADSPVLRNLHISDTGEQMVKVSYEPGSSVGSDGGLVADCLFDYSAGIGPQYYIGGIDAHNAQDWTVRGNTFVDIRSPGLDIAEHAIHFWSASQNTVVEGNRIVNCDRGIGFGLGDRGHQGGIIRNNMIYHDSSEGFADVAIGLETASDALLANNTVIMENSYPNAIEYRFAETTGVTIVNNLTNRAIVARDEASATLSSNLDNAQISWFVDPSSGDLHLASAVAAVVDQGQTLDAVSDDFDGDPRPLGAGFDIGADEYWPGGTSPQAIFSWTPQGPEVGELVRFFDESLFGPASWGWDFGDGATSASQHPTHVYDGAGSYWVTLTVSNQDGSGTASAEITITASGQPTLGDPWDYAYVIPAAAKTAGALGTNWRTDVVLHQAGGQPATAHLFFLERALDNSGAAGVAALVPGNASARMADVVGAVLGRENTSGAIFVGSEVPLLVSSRTYNDQGAEGTFGQFIPGYPLAAAQADGESRLVQLIRNNDYRTNIGGVNVSNQGITVNVQLFLGDGTALATESYQLLAYQYFQDNDLIGRHTSALVGDAFAVVSSPTAGASFFAWASVIDNRTGDPVFIPSDSGQRLKR